MRFIVEELPGFFDPHVQYFSDVLVAKFNLQSFRVVTCAVADGAWRINAWHEQQFDEHEPFSQAILTSPLGHVEREAACLVAARLCRWGFRKKLPHVIEETCVGREIGSRRSADWSLIHPHQSL